MKLWKIVLYAAVIAAFASCSNYKIVTQSDIIYLEKGQDATSVFKNYKADIIRSEFKTITPRFHYNRPYSYYWHTRPLWLDYNFIYDPWHFGHYSFFYRPWNHWDWYMRPWRPYQHNQWSWYNGPFNNQGYNVVYNSGRRGNTRSIKNKIGQASIIASTKPRINNTTPIIIKKHIEDKENHD
jgi:hypothetical protein